MELVAQIFMFVRCDQAYIIYQTITVMMCFVCQVGAGIRIARKFPFNLYYCTCTAETLQTGLFKLPPSPPPPPPPPPHYHKTITRSPA